MIRNKSAVLRRCAAFQGADPSTVRLLALGAEPRRLARRAPLWSDGERADPVVVRSGVLKESADAVTAGFWGGGAIVGTEGISGVMSADVEAYEECVVLQIRGEALEEAMEKDVGLALGVLRTEQLRRRGLQARVQQLVTRNAMERLAATVLSLGVDFGVRDSRGTIVNLRLTHRELAGLIGTTRETVSFAVADLRQDGLIESDGKRVVILDKRGLQKLARSV